MPCVIVRQGACLPFEAIESADGHNTESGTWPV